MDALSLMRELLPDVDPSVLQVELMLAGATINHLRGWDDGRPVEHQYIPLQVELAVSAYAKRGAEGQSSHAEGGISRVYGNSDIYPKELLRRITPRLRGVKL